MPQVFTSTRTRSFVHGLSAWEYLSELDGCARERALCEEWVARYPEAARDDLVARLRRNDDRAHQGAFFELSVHEWFRTRGWHAEPHPKVGATSRRLDFLMRRGDDAILVEARCTLGMSDAEYQKRRDQRRVLGPLAGIAHPEFQIGVLLLGRPRRNLPKRDTQRRPTVRFYTVFGAVEVVSPYMWCAVDQFGWRPMREVYGVVDKGALAPGRAGADRFRLGPLVRAGSSGLRRALRLGCGPDRGPRRGAATGPDG